MRLILGEDFGCVPRLLDSDQSRLSVLGIRFMTDG